MFNPSGELFICKRHKGALFFIFLLLSSILMNALQESFGFERNFSVAATIPPLEV
ncbi:hypothetical protein AXF42_Ash005850 [Apostasia shenzhenica]|uniref:Uncharacterized protein n=1 Tax=Apostasia shenzhenica TaxID=1088818 RepID=A0A2I0BCL2_9ASPA|nr:hypothetical protein AXF42_Ash005850 [Apostasia shenzhenica]